MSPGLAIDKHILSSKDLENYTEPHSWSPAQALQALKEEGWEGCLIHPEGWSESLNNLLCWGCQDVQDVLIQGIHRNTLMGEYEVILCLGVLAEPSRLFPFISYI